jgi:hypothetical protein
MSRIPEFDHNHVLPPHKGNPALPGDVSPYLCDITEFCERFGTSKKRLQILKGFLEFRLKIYELDIVDGFQWLDGSFTQNIELSENRDPNDIDVLTLYKGFRNTDSDSIIANSFQEFVSPKLSKANYSVDHYPFPYADIPEQTVELTRYWVQLFSHNRSGVWKGMLRIEFENKEIEEALLIDITKKYESL